jgi:DNA-binding CsgD family transcriptional regulator
VAFRDCGGSQAQRSRRFERVLALEAVSSATPDAAGEECEELAKARLCYERHEWRDACALFTKAERQAPLDAADLDRLCWAAGLSGDDEGMLAALERLHHARLERGETEGAALAAFWASFRLAFVGEVARASGWLARAARLVEGLPGDNRVRGYLELSGVRKHFAAREYELAFSSAERACAIGERHRDADLVALARNMMGRAMLLAGNIERGLAHIDEAMLSATSGEVSPVVTGIVYCSAIDACERVFALERMQEWTSALGRFCDEQPQLVTFGGACRVHRAEVMILGGLWADAMREARSVFERPVGQIAMDLAESHYRQGEIHRMRGDQDAAEEAYRNASQLGREPQPGLALLRLSQANGAAALQSLKRILVSSPNLLDRARFLPAFVEVALAQGEVEEARTACAELRTVAESCGTPAARAIAGHAEGSLRLAESDASGAVVPLRRAFLVWQELDAPYLGARVRVAIGATCRALGDDEAAEVELSLAREVFAKLGAAPDVRRVDALRAQKKEAEVSAGAQGLSARELQVLRLVATGMTNKAIATELALSEKTVDRHVSNIFTKLGVNSRAAATAHAYQHGLV